MLVGEVEGSGEVLCKAGRSVGCLVPREDKGWYQGRNLCGGERSWWKVRGPVCLTWNGVLQLKVSASSVTETPPCFKQTKIWRHLLCPKS